MQYQQENGKFSVVNAPRASVFQTLPVNQNIEIQRARKILLIILGVLLSISVMGGISIIARSDAFHSSLRASYGAKIGELLISILFYGFGIFVAYRYSAIGLRVFGWITIIMLILSGIAIVLLAIMGGLALSIANRDSYGEKQAITTVLSIMIIVLCIVAIASGILLAIVTKFAFKLARLIDNKNTSILPPI